MRVSLLTRGSPHQLTGGHLYHRRMAAAAPSRRAELDISSVRAFRNPFRDIGDVALVDSLAAAAVAPWVLIRKTSRPLAAIVHQQPGGVGHGAARSAVQRRLDMWLYRRCDLVIAASASIADELRRSSLPGDRICVATPGRDLAPSTGEPTDLRRGRRVAVLCVANWLPNKGIVELLGAIASLPADAVTLHLVGATDVDPPYGARVRARLAARDLVDRVVVHGPVDPCDLAGLFTGADVFALASYTEAYGTVYAEALAAGLPVVGWRSGNLANLVDDATEGCLVEPGDVAGLSRALHRLATDEPWRAQLAAAARRRGQRLPTWDDTADALYGALSRLVAARG